MQRRVFLSAVVAAPLVAGVTAIVAADKPPRFRFEVVKYSMSSIRTMRVIAAPDDVDRFCIAYQDALWPEWQTSANSSARDRMKQIRRTGQWRDGVGLVDVTDSQQRHAFFATCSAFQVPNAEITCICGAISSDSPTRG